MSTIPPTGPARHASQLAQLLSDVMVRAAPATAKAGEDAHRQALEEWLEGLEVHTSGQLAPVVAALVDATDPPEFLRSLLDEVAAPTHQYGSILQQIFLYGVVMSAIGDILTPFMQGVINDTNATAVGKGIHKPLDPAQIATGAARGLAPGPTATFPMPQWAYDQAAMSGVGPEDLNLMASIVGLPPALQELFELFRRGIITIDQVKTGLREGDFRDDWVDTIVQLAHGWLTPLDFVRAAVQAQMTYEDARKWAENTGLDVSTPLPVQKADPEVTADMFGLAFSIAGRPPGPVQLGDMALRGIIPWEGTGAAATTFQQGIAESDVKTKWTPALRALMEYVPPPGTVSTLLERGGITKDQAIALWEKRGVPTEIAQAYAYVSEQQHVSQDKLLAKSDITTAYFDGILSHAQAVESLGLLGYRDDVADDILAIVSFRREIQAINQATRRIESLYGAFKLTQADAMQALETIGIDTQQATALLATWDAIRVAPIRLPTARDIGRAWKAGTLTEAQAIDELGRLGYEPRDAAIVLSGEGAVAFSPLPPAGRSVTAAPGLPAASEGTGQNVAAGGQ